MLGGVRTEIEVADMDGDGGGEAVLVAEAATPDLDRLDAPVDALGEPLARSASQASRWTGSAL